MISAAALSAAATIPAPPAITLIRVVPPRTCGNYGVAPYWYIVGDLRDYAFTHCWQYGTEVKLGDQGDGTLLLDVTDLGLSRDICIAYHDAQERRGELETEEDMYNLHSDPDGECLCGKIAEQQAIMDKCEPVISAAVNERFDAWTRRRHLVALGVDSGLPSCNPGMYDSWLPAAAAAAQTEEPAVDSAALDPYPTWASVAADWEASAFAFATNP
jgi:hypothetical protein